MENVLMGADGVPFDPSQDGGVVAPDSVAVAQNEAGAAEQEESSAGISPILLIGAGLLAYFLFFNKKK